MTVRRAVTGLAIVALLAGTSWAIAQQTSKVPRIAYVWLANTGPSAPHKDAFQLRMQDIGILDGDLLVVHKSSDARSGQIVVARLGEEVTVKRLKRRGREISLVAENPAFPPIVVDPKATPFAIEGIAVGLIRASRSF